MEAGAGKERGSRTRGAWYASGLRFSCLPDCGACCRSHDGYDYVYLAPGDVPRLAARLRLAPDEFRARHVAMDDEYEILAMNGPDCPFLRKSRCVVHGSHPRQCRTFPFWRENLRSRAAWERLSAFCPGVGTGELHPAERIRARLEAEEDP